MQTRHNITLDQGISRELESIAGELGEKKSAIIEKALTAYFDLLDLWGSRDALKYFNINKCGKACQRCTGFS